MNSKRIEYLDVAKGVMMLLVVAGHINDYHIGGIVHDKLFTFIYSFHMCLFFLLSGYIVGLTQNSIKNQSFFKWFWKKVQTLFIPFVIWTLFVWRFIDPILTSPLNLETMKALFLRPDEGVWFFLSLFVTQVVCYPVFRFKSPFAWLVPICVVVLGYLVFSHNSNFELIFIYCDPYHYACFLMGFLIFRYQKWVFHSTVATLALIAFIIVEIIHPNPLLATISAGIAILYASNYFCNNGGCESFFGKKIQFIGKQTMAVYPIHVFLVHSFQEPYFVFNDIHITPVFTVLLVISFFIAVLCAHMAVVISYFPMMDRLLLGKIKKKSQSRYNYEFCKLSGKNHMLEDIVKVYNRNILADSRGYFLKVITGNEDGISDNPVGEIYLTCGNPGQSKGSHYHVAAKEWFTCIQGRALLKLEDTNTHEILSIEMDATNPKTVFIPQLVAHSLDCIGDEPFVVLAYTDKQYDKSDTIPYTINK